MRAVKKRKQFNGRGILQERPGKIVWSVSQSFQNNIGEIYGISAILVSDDMTRFNIRGCSLHVLHMQSEKSSRVRVHFRGPGITN